MPAKSEKQRRAAALEFSRRKRGVKKQAKGKETRPFGSASLSSLKDFMRK